MAKNKKADRCGLLISITFLLVAVGFAWMGYGTMIAAAKIPMPAPTPLAVWLPEGAELRTTSEFHPGTFVESLSLDEFRNEFPRGGTGCFPRDRPGGLRRSLAAAGGERALLPGTPGDRNSPGLASRCRYSGTPC